MSEANLRPPVNGARIDRESVDQAAPVVAGGEVDYRGALDALAGAIYLTDAAGLMTYYNEAAAALWSARPKLGTRGWCSSWRLFWPDGRSMPQDEYPTALALRERRPLHGVEVVAQRSDGSRASFIANSTPRFDESGEFVGTVNMLVDMSHRKLVDLDAQRLASIIQSSEDAIVSKDLNGVVATWNRGAQRVFGYTAEEMIGKPVSILIPPDREDEEPDILQRIRRGERIDHYETVRRRKDGSLVDISLTVSPIRNSAGEIVGASKIARDITERRRAKDQHQLLLGEMNHRIKNVFTLAGSIVALSARSAASPSELADTVRARLDTLARAHALTLSMSFDGALAERPATLHALVAEIASPFEVWPTEGQRRVTVSGDDIALSPQSVTSLGLLLHEFATNAAKYGALSTADGRVDIRCETVRDRFLLTWRERGGPTRAESVSVDGFGTKLIQMAIEGQLCGTVSRNWLPEGLTISLSVPVERLAM